MEPSAHQHTVRESQLQFRIEDVPHGSGTERMQSPPDASVQQQPEGEAEVAEASAKACERRVDPTCPQGASYTLAEFLDFYGSLEQWHAAAPSAPVVPREGGLDLCLSSLSATGYEGVVRHCVHGRVSFKARGPSDGGRRRHGLLSPRPRHAPTARGTCP